ncbi:MAG: DUF2294 domain-containing protein [Thermoleophilaceae bacterium]
MQTPEAGPRLEESRGQLLLELSNAVVRIHKEYHGKGPTKARSHLTQDMLVVVLEGGYTHSEQTLLAAGHAKEVMQSRQAMQATTEPALRAAVEEILKRPVRSFMSANDPTADVQVEIFLLEA